MNDELIRADPGSGRYRVLTRPKIESVGNKQPVSGIECLANYGFLSETDANMPSVVFGSAQFATPLKTIVAKSIDDVLPLLEWSESEARSGSYVALLLSYEAAPAFDSVLRVHPASDFPLAWAAVFHDASNLATNDASDVASNSWTPKVSRAEYDDTVARIRELIAAGDTYQVNYSFPLTSSSFQADTYAWFRDLCIAQGAQYSAYLDLGRYKVLCLSPELFFERRGNHVVTRPMKGTARRGRWSEEDRELAEWLRDSVKDRAENVMIVDLLRNDLGKVAVAGTVHVSSLFDVERFETVWQMTSTVEATLNDGTSLAELMTALFPCGSVTGAPKIRTMEIIHELERFPRGPYTGTIGLLQPGGDCVFNVAIRTVVVDAQTGVATFGVGGGVTIDSTAEGEYEECLVKSRFLHTSPAGFQLFESILLEEGEYFLLEQHLKRLKNSAEFFGFTFMKENVNAQLDQIVTENPFGSFKLRLTLSKDGRVETEVSAMETTEETRTVALATKAVDSLDRFLFHKTTHRDFYVNQPNTIFWNERGEVTESDIANVVVEIDGELVTPPVSAGLLAGTFRNHLLAEGKIRERVITLAELEKPEEFFLINSVRKWMRASFSRKGAKAQS